MGNSTKYNQSTESEALKVGDFWIGTNDVPKGPTSTSGFYNTIPPATGGYVIYVSSGTDDPDIFTCTDDNDLILYTNKIVGTSYTTVNECFNYFNTQDDKMVLNREYEGIITDGLIWNLDSGYRPSYPANGTSWEDVGTGGYDATLYNGVGFSTSDGGVFSFDGTDDYIQTDAAIDLRTNYTVSWVFKGVGNSLSGANGYNTLMGNSAGFRWLYRFSDGKILAQIGNGNNFSTIAAPRNQWNIASFTYDDGPNTRKWYINGVAAGTFTANSNGKNLQMNIGNYGPNNYWMNGNIAIVRAYDRVLSSTEILANFEAQKGRFGIT